MPSTPSNPDERRDRLRRFRDAYALHRGREGRGADHTALAEIPHVTAGPQARQWSVRARTYRQLVHRVVEPRAREIAPRAALVLDLGSGNGWLCYRVHQLGHRALALDLRTDAIDGLGAARGYSELVRPLFARVAATFEAIPLRDRCADIAIFNASLHCALDLALAIGEAARVVARGGRIAVLDSPFYRRSSQGDAMVAEKQSRAQQEFGELAPDLTALPFVEYLTRDRLAAASRSLGIVWRRHAVRYPLWYELRPLMALLQGQRLPSRFDLWEATVP